MKSTLLRDVMTRNVETIQPDANLVEAADRMRRLNVGTLPVCEGKQLQGILTDRDITVRAVAQGLDPNRTRVEQVMSGHVICCFEDQTVADAEALMKQHQIRRLLVLSRDKRILGVVSLGDLAVQEAADDVGDVLSYVSQPAQPAR